MELYLPSPTCFLGLILNKTPGKFYLHLSAIEYIALNIAIYSYFVCTLSLQILVTLIIVATFRRINNF
jgi:hypothetical protein